jgi:hypothetical protein
MRPMALIVMASAALAAYPAFGQEKSGSTPRPASTDRSHSVHGRCECRAGGKIFIEGDETCLNGMVAICDMEQNVTTWRMTRKACPQS